MAINDVAINPRKRRRRRRADRPAVSARLLLDDRMKGELGILSDDLLADLFPGSKQSPEQASSTPEIYHVAVSPWLPNSLSTPTATSWTILPVRAARQTDGNSDRPHSSLQFPANSLALQSFVHALHSISPNKIPRRDTAIEIRILDVAPVGLDTVYVNLDTEGLKRLDEVHAKFGGGFGPRPRGPTAGTRGHPEGTDVNNKHGARARAEQRESEWKDTVRKALQALQVVHSGDLLPLPVPAHPITHAPAPPAKIVFCEPVSQGILLPSTKVVVLKTHGSKPTKAVSQLSTRSAANGHHKFEDEDDASNDTEFFSAAEDRTSERPSKAPSPEEEDTAYITADQLDSELSGTDAGDLSDDSDDMISLSGPVLPPQSSGVLSSYTSATPRLGGFRTNGIATPGSVFSSFTTTTTRGPGHSRSKIFKTQGLLEPVPDELLHPKPSSEEDEEARIFVDTNNLVKIGCFSGDWVRVESTSDSPQNALGAWGLGGAFGPENEASADWRAVKVYGLPEILSKKQNRYPMNKSHDRRSSFSAMLPPPVTATVHLSPVLLANLGEPSHLKITALSPPRTSSVPRTMMDTNRITAASLPPKAKELTLLKLSTPLSTDMLLQPSLFSGLKEYFENKRRILKNGDLVGIAIDEKLGKAVYQGNNAESEDGSDELLARSKWINASESTNAESWTPKSIAWFKVGSVSPSAREDGVDGEDQDPWGGVVSVDVSSIRKETTVGVAQGKVPATMNNPWQYYLGAKRAPRSSFAAGRYQGVAELPKPYISSLRHRLRGLVSAATSPRSAQLGLPPLGILLSSTQRHIGKSTVAVKACEDIGLHTFRVDAFDIVTEGSQGGGDVKAEGFLQMRADRALACGAEYTALLIEHIEALNSDRMTTTLKNIFSSFRVLIATTTDIDKIPDSVRSIFTHELEMSAPDEGEREGILRGIVEERGLQLAPDVELSSVAVKTAALVAGDLVDVVDRAVVAKHNRLEGLAQSAAKSLTQASPRNSLPITLRDIELAGGPAAIGLTLSDFTSAVDAARKNFADAIGAPKIPNVSWSDVGGLSHVKEAVMETIQLPLSRPELFAKGMKKRSGILFYGPPGTGKTLLAKAIATEFSLNFFSVKGPELLNMYIGESEANVRRVFQRARDARPCVVFFDELDSVAPKRGNQGDSGGVMDRIVSQLLAELDGMSDGAEGAGGVFVIGATNRPDLLDQALLRPGRFDKMLYLGVSDTHEKQLTILQALTRKFTLDPDLDLRRVASLLPFTYTGADLYALCSDAMLKAITRSARLVDQKVAALNEARQAARPGAAPISIPHFFDHHATAADTQVVVREQDFLDAKRELVPSVSADELRHYERVRATFEGEGERKRAEHARVQERIAREVGRGTAASPAVEADSWMGNGKGKGKGKGKAAVMGPEEVQEEFLAEDGAVRSVPVGDEEDYVIRLGGDGPTQRDDGGASKGAVAADANGDGGGGSDGAATRKGKGKGKAMETGAGAETAMDGFGDAAQGDEGLYD